MVLLTGKTYTLSYKASVLPGHIIPMLPYTYKSGKGFTQIINSKNNAIFYSCSHVNTLLFA